MNNKKGFTNILLVVLAVVVAGAVGYFYWLKKSEPTATTIPATTQNQNVGAGPAIGGAGEPIHTITTDLSKTDKSTWGTYKNDTFGFQFQFPKNFEFKAEIGYVPDVVLRLAVLGDVARLGVYPKDKLVAWPLRPQTTFTGYPNSLDQLKKEFSSLNGTKVSNLPIVIEVKDIKTDSGVKGLFVQSKYAYNPESGDNPETFTPEYYFYKDPYFIRFASGYAGSNQLVDSNLAEIAKTLKFAK